MGKRIRTSAAFGRKPADRDYRSRKSITAPAAPVIRDPYLIRNEKPIEIDVENRTLTLCKTFYDCCVVTNNCVEIKCIFSIILIKIIRIYLFGKINQFFKFVH